MAQLGFTFYPKDWWTSDSFYTLNPFERYIYLELLFMMYDNKGSIKNDKVKVERRLGTTIKDDVWSRITDLMVEDGDLLTHVSVNKRLKKAIANRENGKKGGRPPKDEEKPKEPKKETHENPPLERENKYISISIKEEERLVFESLKSLMDEFLNDSVIIEDFQRSIGPPYPSVEELTDIIKSYFVKLTVDGESIKDRKDAIYHFKSWCRLEKESKNKRKANEQSQKQGGAGNFKLIR